MLDDQKGGARHSQKDMDAIRSIVDAAFSLGAVCPYCQNQFQVQKASMRDSHDRIFAAWVEMMEYAGGENEFGAYPYEYYNDTIVVRFGDGRYAAYRFVELDGTIMFGPPYLVEKVFVPVQNMADIDAISGSVKAAADETVAEIQTEPEPQEPQVESSPEPETQSESSPEPEPERKSAGYKYFDNSLKIISQTEDELRVGNYILLFEKKDLEGLGSKRKNADGTRGEFFTKNTQWQSPYTETGVIHVDWEHGEDYDLPDLAGEHGILGYANFKNARVDEQGVFVERVLNRRNKYVTWLTDLIAAGLVGTSSQAIRGRVKKSDDGEIELWPLSRDTLTVSPMQWENIGELPETVYNSLKSLAVHCPDLADECKAVGLNLAGADEATLTTETRGGDSIRVQLEIEGENIVISERE